MTKEITMPDPLWAPIVYGRTNRADSWWRAVPPELPHRGWLGTLVSTIVASGDHLDRPRFLLARWNEYWVTGVACMAGEFDPELSSDGVRPLYTFVGWAAPFLSPARPPEFDELEKHFRDWAGPVYQEWVGRDWDQHPSKVRDAHATAAQVHPWPDPGVVDGKALDPARDTVEIWPDADRAALWRAATITDSPFVLAVGWEGQNSVPRADLTHATAGDLETIRRVPLQPGELEWPEPVVEERTAPSDRPRITVTVPPPRPSFVASGLRALGGLVSRGPLDDPGPRVEVRLLILDGDNVLVRRTGDGWELLGGPVSTRESPTAACRRIAYDTLRIPIVVNGPLLVTYSGAPDRGHLSLVFHGELTTDVTVWQSHTSIIALRPVTDPTLPASVQHAVAQLAAGSPDTRYSEHP
jgi:ADP-ribose pyrophosphatase YjhB (NUDIX family)